MKTMESEHPRRSRKQRIAALEGRTDRMGSSRRQEHLCLRAGSSSAAHWHHHQQQHPYPKSTPPLLEVVVKTTRSSFRTVLLKTLQVAWLLWKEARPIQTKPRRAKAKPSASRTHRSSLRWHCCADFKRKRRPLPPATEATALRPSRKTKWTRSSRGLPRRSSRVRRPSVGCVCVSWSLSW